MTQFLDGPKSRLDAVLAGGRGADGSLGSDATARSIPAGRFRPTPYESPIEDMAIHGATVDRSYVWIWLGIADEAVPNNDYNSVQIRRLRASLEIGYIYGAPAQMSAFIDTASGTTESANTAVTVARTRALSDAERIRRALCFTALTANNGTGDIDPVVIGVTRDGESSVVDLSHGKLKSVTRYSIYINANGNTSYDP